MGLFNHKENRDITATSPANTAYPNDGTTAGGYQTGNNIGRNDGYDGAYDNTRTASAMGANEPYRHGHHGTNTVGGTGLNNTTGNAYNDDSYGNQPGVGNTGMAGNRFNEPNANTNAYNDGAYGTNTNTGMTGTGRHTGAGLHNQSTAQPNTLDNTPAYNDGTYGTNTNTGMTGTGRHTGTGLHNQSTAQPNTLDTGTGVGGSPYSAAGQQTSAFPSDREARHLERSGKIEKAIGTVLCSTTMKQKGLQKQAEGQNIAMQSHQLGQAEQLEAQAKAMRGQAVGLGAHPNHLTGGNAQGTAGTQYNNTY